MRDISAEESPLWQAIMEAIKECIDHHGPVDKNFAGSAAKRIMRNLIRNKAIEGIIPNDVRMMLAQIGVRKSKYRTKIERHLVIRCNQQDEKIKRLRLEIKRYRNLGVSGLVAK
jgi:hypothetical protein